MIENKKIVAIIEARMTSTRFPGKVLKPIGDIPALDFMVRRVRESKYIDDVVVACTVNHEDEPIKLYCDKSGISYYRGSEDDVLERVLDAAIHYSTDVIVELTGDCPFVDPDLLDQVISLYFDNDVDYASNIVKRTFPDGCDIQVFSVDALKKVDSLTDDPIARVHVSSYFYTTKGIFSLANLEAPADFFWPDLGLTLDEVDDYKFLCAIFDKIGKSVESFRIKDVIEVLRNNPDLMLINDHVRRKSIEEG